MCTHFNKSNIMPPPYWIRKWRYLSLRWLRWGSEHISPRNYQILVSIIIGLVSGLMAVGLKFLVHVVRDWAKGNDPTSERWGFVFFPVIGIGLTIVFVRFVLRYPLDSGLSSLIYAISRKRVNLPPREMYAHVVASSLTVGLGGSVGLEAPIVRTGSAIGANLARLLGVGRKRQTLFLACGAAAGMAAIFNSPIAGVIFSLEVLLTEIAIPSFIPIIIAAATGAVVAKVLYFEQIFFLPIRDWEVESLPFYVALGIGCGLLSVYIIRLTGWLTERLTQWIPGLISRILASGVALGVLVFLMPPLFGEGYETINALLAGHPASVLDHSLFYGMSSNPWLIIGFAVSLVLAKAVATSITIAGGGAGGKFAPTMFTGALWGFVFVQTTQALGWAELRGPNFMVAGMAGMLSGVFKSPLTGIFLIAEITGGYTLFVPLMLVSALGYFISLYFEPHSTFTRELAFKGLWAPSHERDWHILKDLEIRPLVETNFTPVYPKQKLGDFVKVIAQSKRSVFPVVNEEKHFLGVVLLDDVREVMFDTDQYEILTVEEIMHNPPAVVDVNEPMSKVMEKFDYFQAWNLPVVDEGLYVGFVSKSHIFNAYRQSLIDRSDLA